jgi:C4-dicarboxylate transporter DctQ subunit
VADAAPRPKRAWYEHLEEGLLAFLMVAMTLVSFVQVIARYAFNYSFSWALELVTQLFGALIFIGIAYGIRTGAHLGVDILIARLKAPAARAFAAVAAVLCLVYAGIVFVGGWKYVAKMYQIGIMSQDLPLQQWIPRAVLPIGIALAFWRFAEVLVDVLRGRRVRLLGDEAQDALRLEEHDPGDAPDARDARR